jgi:hypothetical protein
MPRQLRLLPSLPLMGRVAPPAVGRVSRGERTGGIVSPTRRAARADLPARGRSATHIAEGVRGLKLRRYNSVRFCSKGQLMNRRTGAGKANSSRPDDRIA